MMSINDNGNRDDWTFRYKAVDLAKGAQSKLKFRLEKVEWWKARKEEVKVEIKDNGINFDESIADISGLMNNSSGRQKVFVRDDLQKKLDECNGKTREHQ